MHGLDSLVPLFHTRVRGTRIVVTPQFVTDVLHVSRVEHLDYPGCEHLRTVSKDKMISTFCKHPSNWSDRQFTPCKTFSKGPRFINMVMTFVLHPLSHYNSIIQLHAQFLFSLLEHLTIDFPFILFFQLQMCLGIWLPVISSFSLRLSYRFYATFLFIFPLPTTVLSCVPQTPLPLNVARHSLGHNSRIQQLLLPIWLHLVLLHPHLLPLLLRVMCHSGTSWHSYNAWMLALIHSLQSCIR